MPNLGSFRLFRFLTLVFAVAALYHALPLIALRTPLEREYKTRLALRVF